MRKLLVLFGVQVALLAVGAWAAAHAPAGSDAAAAVRFAPGDDATSDVVNVFDLARDGSTLTLSLFGAPRATVTATSLFHVQATRDATVVLRASATGTDVERYHVTLGAQAFDLARDAPTVATWRASAGADDVARVELALGGDAAAQGAPVTVTFAVHALS